MGSFALLLAGGPATAFRAGRPEHVPGGTLLVVAYAVVWAFLFGFVLLLWRRQARLRDEIERLERTIANAAKKPRGP